MSTLVHGIFNDFFSFRLINFSRVGDSPCCVQLMSVVSQLAFFDCLVFSFRVEFDDGLGRARSRRKPIMINYSFEPRKTMSNMKCLSLTKTKVDSQSSEPLCSQLDTAVGKFLDKGHAGSQLCISSLA